MWHTACDQVIVKPPECGWELSDRSDSLHRCQTLLFLTQMMDQLMYRTLKTQIVTLTVMWILIKNKKYFDNLSRLKFSCPTPY